MHIFSQVDVTDPQGALSTIFRASHIISGITWIGLLYFFNFIQTPAFGEMSDGARSEALRKITFRTLWWFRYAALLTFLFGIALVGLSSNVADGAPDYLSGVQGTAILTGMLFGITMFLNVWGVIWRAQKVIIASAESVAAGGAANPDAAALAKPASRASRCNTFMSITMLWFMVFAAHGIYWFDGIGGTVGYWVFVLVLWAVVEGSALGLLGGFDSPVNKMLFDKHRDTIIYGFVYLGIIYLVGWGLILKA